MAEYIVYKVETTKARQSADGKAHTHKYYLYPLPGNLRDFGFNAFWSYEHGKRGALRFTSKAEAEAIAKARGARVEEV